MTNTLTYKDLALITTEEAIDDRGLEATLLLMAEELALFIIKKNMLHADNHGEGLKRVLALKGCDPNDYNSFMFKMSLEIEGVTTADLSRELSEQS